MRMVFRFLLVSLSVCLLSACVTETIGPQREVNPEKLLRNLLSLGAGYISKGEYGRAKQNLTRALDLDPKSYQAHNTFGLVYQLEGEDALAEKHFKKAISLKSDFSPVRNNYGAFLYAKGRYADAVEQLEVAAGDRLYQSRATAFENLGVSYLQLGKVDKATMAFGRSSQLNPNQARALLELAILKYDSRDYQEAKQYYYRHDRVARKSARSLWLCIRIAKVFGESDNEASCALTLKNVFPGSNEYKLFQKGIH